jgi:tetratricopeptide (TPR) repeat protein
VVANIKSRDELLSYFNLLLMLWFAYKYFDTGKFSTLLFSLLFFYLALLSKETAVTGLALLPALFFFSERLTLTDALKKVIPYILMLILFLIQKKMLLGTLTGIPPEDIVNYPYTETAVKIPTVNFLYFISLKLLVFPHPLRYDYSYNQIPGVDFSHPGALAGIILFITGAVVIFKYYKTKSPFILGLLVLYINLTPGLAFTIVRGGIFAERLLFLPSLGFSIALVAAAASLMKLDLTKNTDNLLSKVKSNSLFVGLFLVIAALYITKTFTRNFAWKNEAALYSADIKSGQNSTQNLRHYGTEMMRLFLNEKADTAKRNKYKEEALKSFYRAVTIHPKFGEVYIQLGVLNKEGLGNVDSGLYYFNKAITVNPGLAIGYYNIGTTYQSMGQNNVASYYYNESIKYNPNYPDAVTQKNYLKTNYGLDVQINPLGVKSPDSLGTEKNSAYYYGMGNYYAAKGDYNLAAEQFKQSVAIDPGNVDSWINLGNCYGMLKLYDLSISTLEDVVKKFPENSRAIENLATTYKNAGNDQKAEEYTRRANALRNKQ